MLAAPFAILLRQSCTSQKSESKKCSVHAKKGNVDARGVSKKEQVHKQHLLPSTCGTKEGGKKRGQPYKIGRRFLGGGGGVEKKKKEKKRKKRKKRKWFEKNFVREAGQRTKRGVLSKGWESMAATTEEPDRPFNERGGTKQEKKGIVLIRAGSEGGTNGDGKR